MSRANNRNTRFLPASVTLNFKGTPKRANGCLDKIEAKTASPTFLSATVRHITLKFLALLERTPTPLQGPKQLKPQLGQVRCHGVPYYRGNWEPTQCEIKAHACRMKVKTFRVSVWHDRSAPTFSSKIPCLGTKKGVLLTQ